MQEGVLLPFCGLRVKQYEKHQKFFRGFCCVASAKKLQSIHFFPSWASHRRDRGEDRNLSQARAEGTELLDASEQQAFHDIQAEVSAHRSIFQLHVVSVSRIRIEELHGSAVARSHSRTPYRKLCDVIPYQSKRFNLQRPIYVPRWQNAGSLRPLGDARTTI